MITVCIIEDLFEIQLGLKTIIDDDPRFVLLRIYDNAEEAIATLPSIKPNIVITDINLPGKSGIECIQSVKETAPEIQFIMFTIYEDSDQVFDALKAGANGYILKNTSSEKIIESLIDLSEGGSPMNAKIARKVIAAMHNKPTDQNLNALTARENEVLQFLSKGFLYKEIAHKLNISISTVKKHLSHVYEKLQVQNKTEAINKMYRK